MAYDSLWGCGMMGQGYGVWSIFPLLYLLLLIGLVVLVYVWIIRLWKPNKRNR